MPSTIRPTTTTPTFEEVTSRWNSNAHARLTELSGNHDAAYRALVNLICSRLGEACSPPAKVLDVGSGLGFLSARLADLGYNVTAIEPSENSVKIARSIHREPTKPAGALTFHVMSLADLVAASSERRFDSIVANMTLHCAPRIATFMTHVRKLITDDGVFHATVPNPDNYLQSRSDLQLGDVDLRADQVFELPFRIHNSTPHPSPVVYYHRPIRTYLSAIEASGMWISDYLVPEHIGTGKPRDIAYFEVRPRSTTQNSVAAP